MCRRPHRPLRDRRCPAGFSVLELLVILSVMGIVLLFAVPYTLSTLGRIRLEGATDQVVSLMQSTRMRAIRDRQTYSFEYDAVDKQFEGMVGIGTGTGSSQAGTFSLEENGLTIYTDPPCVAATTDSQTHTAGALAYDATGIADENRAFCFQDAKGNVMQVAVDSPYLAPKIRKHLVSVDKFSPDPWDWDWY